MKTIKIVLCLFLLLLGFASVFMTTSIVFDLFGIRAMEGNYVLFIVYANMICGFLYLYSAYAIWNMQKSAVWALGIAVLILIFSFIWFGLYIREGGVYEMQTVKGMSFRTIITLIMLIVTSFLMKKYKTLIH